MSRENPFLGSPTAPLVDKLMTAIGNGLSRDGALVTHEMVEQMIDCPRNSGRYRSVVSSWRKRLIAERGIVLDGRRSAGKGFTVLSASGMVDHGCSGLRAARRQVGRAHLVVGITPDAELDPAGKVRRDHVYLQTGTVLSALIGAGRAISSLNKRPEVMPKALK